VSTLVNEYGRGLVDFDIYHYNGSGPTLGTTAVIDASGEKVAFVGRIWHPTRPAGTFNIRKVIFRAGAVTSGPLSVVRVSLQDVNLTGSPGGPPYQPDGTQDQTYDFASGTITANAINTSGNLSADRTVSQGDAFCVVWEYQNFIALDSVIINTIDMGSTNPTVTEIGGRALINLTGTWAVIASMINNVAFECDDGSKAFFIGSPIFSAGSTTVSVGNAAAIRAAGNRFSVPTARTIDRLLFQLAVPNNADGNLILYDGDGTTVLLSVAIDNDAVTAAGTVGFADVTFPPITLTAGVNYRWVFVATTSTTVSVRVADVSAADLLDFLVGGSNCQYTERDSGGTWTQTTTRHTMWGYGLAASHDGAGGGGGLAAPVVGGRLIGHGNR
jgi:hypothetical protein